MTILCCLLHHSYIGDIPFSIHQVENPKYSDVAKECHISRLNICKRNRDNETVRKIKPCIKKQFTETKVAAGYSLDVFKCRINRYITSKQLSSFEKYKEKIVHSS